MQNANRKQRRAAKAIARTSYKRNWGDWEERSDQGFYDTSSQNFLGAYVNDVFSVQVFKEGEFLRVGVRRHDESVTVLWKDLQRIKNELFGKEELAVQVFPPESVLVDAANMYWIYIYPPEQSPPFKLMGDKG